MLSHDDAKIVYDGLSLGYKPVESRLEVGKNNSAEFEDVLQHIILYKAPSEWNESILNYDNVNNITKSILNPYLDKINNILENHIISYKYGFLIMSTDWCGKKRHIKHLHTLIQDNPQRCITMSFPIPLWIDTNSDKFHNFYWYYQDQLYPKITYTSSARMEKISRSYSAINIPKYNISSLLFDSSRTIHYIDNSPHLYLWVVCDGVELMSRNMINGVEIRVHGDVI